MTLAQQKAKIIGFGLLVYVAWNIGLFGAAMVFGFEDVSPPPASDMLTGTLIASVAAGLTAWWLTRRLRLDSQQARMMVGVIWMVFVAVLLLVVTAGNGTTDTVFSQWGAYVSFLAIVIGAMFGKQKNEILPTHSSPP